MNEDQPRERPILFRGEMVRAILAGMKTQTRRVIKPQPPKDEDFRGSYFGVSRAVAGSFYSQNDYDRLPKHPTDWELIGSVGVAGDAGFPMRYKCPYGSVGDLLWCRETWRTFWSPSDEGIIYTADNQHCSSRLYPGRFSDIMALYHAHGNCHQQRNRSSLHMPRWASRITLEVTGVRVQRVQDISEVDAIAEGGADQGADATSDIYHGPEFG